MEKKEIQRWMLFGVICSAIGTAITAFFAGSKTTGQAGTQNESTHLRENTHQ